MTKDLRQIVKEAQRKDLHDEQPDILIETIANSCGVSRAHLFDLMAGKPDPAKVKEWTIHRLSKGLDSTTEDIRAAIKLSRRKAQRKQQRQSSLLDE